MLYSLPLARVRFAGVYHDRRPQSGSLASLAWTTDGTQLAGAGGNGAVVFGQVIERSLEWENFEVGGIYATLWSEGKVVSADWTLCTPPKEEIYVKK